VLASTESYLAQVALISGDDREADRRARRCAALATEDDAWAQVAWRQVRARVLAGRGQARRGLDLAREAVEMARATDHLNLQADAIIDLAIVQEAAGCHDEAVESLSMAVGTYTAKGNAVRAREARRLLARPLGV
jgi:ATP/maltotriose-dependent transcriptional regulator MalT